MKIIDIFNNRKQKIKMRKRNNIDTINRTIVEDQSELDISLVDDPNK